MPFWLKLEAAEFINLFSAYPIKLCSFEPCSQAYHQVGNDPTDDEST
jgi:hypothetical protein